LFELSRTKIIKFTKNLVLEIIYTVKNNNNNNNKFGGGSMLDLDEDASTSIPNNSKKNLLINNVIENPNLSKSNSNSNSNINNNNNNNLNKKYTSYNNMNMNSNSNSNDKVEGTSVNLVKNSKENKEGKFSYIKFLNIFTGYPSYMEDFIEFILANDKDCDVEFLYR